MAWRRSGDKPLSEPIMVSLLTHICVTRPHWVNPLHAKFFRGNINIYFTFYVIPPHWYDTGSWNPSSSNTRTYLSYIVNIMAADVLVTQGARASATMILTMLIRINKYTAYFFFRSKPSVDNKFCLCKMLFAYMLKLKSRPLVIHTHFLQNLLPR